MAEHDVQDHPQPGLSRRKLIRRGMIAGGVALWSAPVVASAAWSRRGTSQPTAEELRKQFGFDDNGDEKDKEEPKGPTGTCIGYPAGTCIDFVCLGEFTVCGSGPDDTTCFCDIDVTGACVCRNDAECDELDTCGSNADCPAGWFCIPSSCCGGARCAPPCGVVPD
jgi:hypothetical protein